MKGEGGGYSRRRMEGEGERKKGARGGSIDHYPIVTLIRFRLERDDEQT